MKVIKGDFYDGPRPREVSEQKRQERKKGDETDGNIDF